MGDRDEQVSWLAVLSPCAAFPDRQDPVAFDAERTAYSCGGSPGIEPEFPLNPPEGNVSRTLTVPQNPDPVNWGPPSATAALTVTAIAGRLPTRSGVRGPHGRRVKREAGEPLGDSPALPPQR